MLVQQGEAAFEIQVNQIHKSYIEKGVHKDRQKPDTLDSFQDQIGGNPEGESGKIVQRKEALLPHQAAPKLLFLPNIALQEEISLQRKGENCILDHSDSPQGQAHPDSAAPSKKRRKREAKVIHHEDTNSQVSERSAQEQDDAQQSLGPQNHQELGSAKKR